MKQILLAFIAILNFTFGMAMPSNGNEPVQWNVQIKTIDANTFQIVAEAKMKEGFHIWALDAGGDGSLINTEISVEGDGFQWQEENWQSNQKPKSETYEFIDGKVNYFEKQVKLSRTFKTSSKPELVKGTITFQSCNEAMCFPPKDIPFSLEPK